MNKEDFLAELRRLLKVKKSDKESIMEEYNSYFKEAMANGETEEDIISSLETPEEIAKNCNNELGVEEKGFSFTIDDDGKEFLDGLSSKLSGVFDKLDEKLNVFGKKVEKTVEKTVETVDVEETINKAVSSVGKAVNKAVEAIKDVNIDAAVSGVAMKFDNSKISSFEFSGTELNVNISDENAKPLLVQIVSSEEQIISKVLPTTLPVEISLEENTLNIVVASSNIRYSEKKRMRLYIPQCVEQLNIVSKCPISISDLEVSLDVKTSNSPISVTDIDGDKLNVECKNGPVSITDIQSENVSIKTLNGPISFKDVNSTTANVQSGNGPVNCHDLRIDEFDLVSGSGPLSIKDVHGVKLNFTSQAGPVSFKDLTADEISITAQGAVVSLKDIECRILKGDISGAMKSIKNVNAEQFDLNQ